jgi:hypothetical protein
MSNPVIIRQYRLTERIRPFNRLPKQNSNDSEQPSSTRENQPACYAATDYSGSQRCVKPARNIMHYRKAGQGSDADGRLFHLSSQPC